MEPKSCSAMYDPIISCRVCLKNKCVSNKLIRNCNCQLPVHEECLMDEIMRRMPPAQPSQYQEHKCPGCQEVVWFNIGFPQETIPYKRMASTTQNIFLCLIVCSVITLLLSIGAIFVGLFISYYAFSTGFTILPAIIMIFQAHQLRKTRFYTPIKQEPPCTDDRLVNHILT